MRKKSHIVLARFIIDTTLIQDLGKHKKSFMIGNIQPDCMPSFLTRKHTIDATMSILRSELHKITTSYDVTEGINGYYSKHLGIILHYIADYFTLPHNHVFQGNLKEHCSYENELKHRLKEYVNSQEAKNASSNLLSFKTVEDIINFIKDMHKQYLMAKQDILTDCKFIVSICVQIVGAIVQLFDLKVREKEFCIA